MKDNVMITIIGIQADMMDDEQIELQTTGKWFTKNGKEHLIYTNHDLVETGDTRTRVTADKGLVSIIRSGAVNTHLVFEQGVAHQIPYETPFGLMDMISSTKTVDISKSEESIEIKVIYNLEINNADIGQNTFHLIAKRLEN